MTTPWDFRMESMHLLHCCPLAWNQHHYNIWPSQDQNVELEAHLLCQLFQNYITSCAPPRLNCLIQNGRIHPDMCQK